MKRNKLVDLVQAAAEHAAPDTLDLWPTIRARIEPTPAARSSRRWVGVLTVFAAVILVWAGANLPLGVDYASQESLVGRLGSAVAPLLEPAGFGSWQAGVALVFGLLAKEVVVGTFGTLLGVGEEGLAAVLPQFFTPLAAYAFLVMTLLYIPCVAVIAAFKRETNSWKWTGFLVLYTTLLAYGAAVLVYQGGRFFGLE